MCCQGIKIAKLDPMPGWVMTPTARRLQRVSIIVSGRRGSRKFSCPRGRSSPVVLHLRAGRMVAKRARITTARRIVTRVFSPRRAVGRPIIGRVSGCPCVVGRRSRRSRARAAQPRWLRSGVGAVFVGRAFTGASANQSNSRRFFIIKINWVWTRKERMLM